ncbi:hypothetical protein EDEG_03857 [Edhazardia aedis USNM 41457]|uniref:Uncharacterized protein n=1 Tax=Edhazardia aedis (strain USNM 41457) TaxID=1003232 RepID=J9D1Z7_EDHAE|nr:hypothetical protein EDEG_03857 [Edhazardia aedis USNM 41457]|eukprot:EJW01599.1 hypothetical protein EDEG_03857 [Edhazardia aedis USNM 41457]
MRGSLTICLQLLLIKSKSKLDLSKVSDQFIAKPIQIFFTHFSHVHVAVNINDKGKSPFVGVSKYLNAEKTGYNNKSRITRNGEKYEIKVGDDMLCAHKGSLVMCDDTENTLWEITKGDFGYTIGIHGKCITKNDDDELTLSNCLNNEDQLFDFKRFSMENKCVPPKENGKGDGSNDNKNNGDGSKAKDSSSDKSGNDNVKSGNDKENDNTPKNKDNLTTPAQTDANNVGNDNNNNVKKIQPTRKPNKARPRGTPGINNDNNGHSNLQDHANNSGPSNQQNLPMNGKFPFNVFNGFGPIPYNPNTSQKCRCNLMMMPIFMAPSFIDPACMQECGLTGQNAKDQLPYYSSQQGMMPLDSYYTQLMNLNNSTTVSDKNPAKSDPNGPQNQPKLPDNGQAPKRLKFTPQERYDKFNQIAPEYANQYGYVTNDSTRTDIVPDEVRRVDNEEMTDLRHTVDEMLDNATKKQ